MGKNIGRSNLVEVTLEKRMDDPKKMAVAFWQGDWEHNSEDSGSGREQEKWIWLPRSQIEVEDDGNGKTCTVTLPEWLAMDKGLI